MLRYNDAEKWRDCVGYEGLYQVSNYGNVRSLDKLVWNRFEYIHRQGKLMKTNVDKYGYVRVVLCKKGHRTNEQIHRLVALAFLDNPNNLPQVNHKDTNKQNNFVDNLEWCTNLCNMHHAFENIDFNYDTTPVVKIDIETNIVIREYNSITEAAKDIADNPINILRSCNFDNDSTKGYRWRKNIDGEYKVGDYIDLPKLYHPSTKRRKVAKILDGNVVEVYNSIMEAARTNSCKNSSISMCCKGKIKQHHGFKWKYYEEVTD